MTDDELSILIEDKIPGKVITASMYFLTAWSKGGPSKRARESKEEEGVQQMSKHNRASPLNSLEEGSAQLIHVETVLEDSNITK
jgi:hypothetical protein